jgi:hypothetical protein
VAEPAYNPTIGGASANGIELQIADLAAIGSAAGLADDHVFAELLRLAPYDGSNVTKAVLPYGYRAAAGTVLAATVSATTGTVLNISPFRAIVGSRTAVGTDALKNWRDIRSALYAGGTVTLDAGNPPNFRWDLVYATLTVDQPATSRSIRVKDASSSVVTNQTAYINTAQSLTLHVAKGTPGSTPTSPALPADSPPGYNIPLALVRVGPGSVVAAKDIRDCAPVVQPGGLRCRPASSNADQSDAAWNNAYVGLVASRPAIYLPRSMGGVEVIFVEIDCSDSTSANWSHADHGVVDDSADWRNRFFLSFASASSYLALPNVWANDPGGAGTICLPDQVPAFPVFGQSFADGDGIAAGPIIYSVTSTTLPSQWTGSGFVTLYVDLSDGKLKVHLGGTGAQGRVFFMVFATGAFPNA